MADNNFYEWLELPVEHFESDPVRLASILEKYITAWNSSKSIQLQNRAAINQAAMRAAIKDADLWKKIYLEYKKAVDAKILDALVMCADNQKIDADQVNAIAASCKVSVDYVETIAKSNSYIISGKVPSPIPKPEYSIKDLEPETKIKGQLDSIQKSINELGFSTLAELIDHELNTEALLSSASKDSILEALKDIKKKWSKVSASNKEKHQQKSHFDRICSGMASFLKSYEIQDYIKYLNWKRVNDILNNLRAQLTSLNLEVLNDKPYNNTVDSIYSVIGDREKAKSILEAFCIEKGIAFPKPLPNILVCPFCSNSFERKIPMLNNCPSCKRSFIVTCPKCGKQKNFLEDSQCDGIDLLQYPYLERQLQELQRMLDALDYNIVRIRVTDITQKWANFPGSAELLSQCQNIEKNYGTDLLKLKQLCDERRFFEAKIICDRLGATYPNFKNARQGIYETIARSNDFYESAMAEKDADKRVELLLEATALVVDHTKAIAEIKKYPVAPISDLRVVSHATSVVLSWSSKNKPNSVQFTVLRKENTPISNHNDGEELGVTQSASFSDSKVEEGKVYYYAVYAQRGPLKTPVCITQEATVALVKPDVKVNPKDSGASISWQYSSIQIKAYVSEMPITKFGQGDICKGISSTGFDLEGLVNGRKYYVGVYKIITHCGKEYRSEGCVQSVTPMVSVKPPEITKSIGRNDGEYIITHTNPTNGAKLDLYYSQSQASITSNSSMNLVDLRKMVRKATIVNLGNNQYTINMNGATEMYIYPVICRGDVATVGNYLCLRYAKSIQITKSIISGNKLCLYIDDWVAGADALFLCYNDDVYPQDKDDADKRISISQTEFNRTRLLEIQNVQNQKYYISIFARKSGEYIPVCNHIFDNSTTQKIVVNYSFHISFLGAVSVVIESNAIVLPAIDICVNDSCVPLTKQGGKIVHTIPSGTSGNATIKIPGLVANGTKYAKLFTDDSNYQLKLKHGDGKIKK